MRESGSGLYSDLRVLGGSSASNAVLFRRDDFYGGTFDSSLRNNSCADLLTQCNFSNVRVSLPDSVEGIILHFISPGAIGRHQGNGGVILCAIGSPLLLLFSGVGPHPYLFSWGIPVSHHLPYALPVELEFSTCEFYVAYNDLMDHTMKMLNGAVKELTSGYKIKHYANGRFIDLINEVVNQHRLIFISSTGPAGKTGPALNTVGAPGGTTSSITGACAYVSPALGAGAHCVVEPTAEGLQYTWSSRGSTGDDDRGICISAPGGAVATVLTWTFQRCMLMNGTSMASPSACGGVALLISAMKWTVQVELLFHEDASNLEQLFPFEECLKLHATEKVIVQAPEYLLLTNNGQSFNIVDDPTNLRDIMHYFELYGVDCKAPWRGPLFRVLITMARPIVLTDKTPLITFSEMRFVPGHKERRFIEVPRGANSFEVTVRTFEYTARRLFIVTLQICPLERQIKWKRADTFASPSAKGFLFPLEDGQTMEFSVAQFWSCGIGSQEIANAEFEFKDEEEVVAVTAHEIAHWKLNHTAFSFIAVQILTILQFGGYTLVKNPKVLIQSFGVDTASTHWAHPLSAYSDSRSNPCQPSFLNFRWMHLRSLVIRRHSEGVLLSCRKKIYQQ